MLNDIYQVDVLLFFGDVKVVVGEEVWEYGVYVLIDGNIFLLFVILNEVFFVYGCCERFGIVCIVEIDEMLSYFGLVCINVKGVFIVDQDSSILMYFDDGWSGFFGWLLVWYEIQDIWLLNYIVVVSYIVIDVGFVIFEIYNDVILLIGCFRLVVFLLSLFIFFERFI